MTRRVAGVDLGKASASFALATLDERSELRIERTDHVVHEGQPFEVFRRWYREHEVGSCAALGVTGTYAVELAEPALQLPVDACQEAALRLLPELPEVLDLVSVGAHGYSVLSRRRGPTGALEVRFLENDKCSSGTGENIRKIANRFGLDVAEADRLALSAGDAIPITARCSVFAKSEMTHYANQGRPTEELFAGFFASVARNARSLLERNHACGPVYLVGGCARSLSLRQSLGALVPGGQLRVPKRFLEIEALGAARLAADQLAGASAAALPADPEALIRPRGERFRVLPAASEARDRVTVLRAEAPAGSWKTEPVVLGLDLGSTGAKATLVGIDSGELLHDVYDRTRGNPVDASRRLIATILEEGRPDVRAIGVTGSGREAVATLLRAVFPEAGERLVVQNEIVAHATAAIRCDPEGGRDLTVIEIGGQDAKYIRVSGGRIVESDMNKACSAGTGSFLEEQAACYEVHDIADFVGLAKSARRPPDLGQMCTVYVADAGAEALKDGFELADVFGGFQYSVIENYLNRVMGQRALTETVFLQGKPASNESLAWTLASITGRAVTVPPNPGAMGAWGIGLSAVSELGAEALADGAPPLDIAAVLDAAIVERKEFRCRDKDCATLCPIERTTIRVGDVSRDALSGGACPKYEVAAGPRRKLPKDAPDPFREREALLDGYERDVPGRPAVAIPVTGGIAAYLPWLATLIGELGFPVRVLRATPRSLAEGEQLCNSFDSCGPTKIAHAICDSTDAPYLFFPKLIELGDAQGPGGQTCVTEQAMPEIVEQSFRRRGRDVKVVRPTLSLHEGLEGWHLTADLLGLAKALGFDPLALPAALEAAARAQRSYHRELLAIGRRAIDWGRQHDAPMVLVAGCLHVIHDPAINATIPLLLRSEGALAIPADCMPVPDEIPRLEKIYWADSNRFLRAALAARRARDVFPLLLCSFGCGPTSFTEQTFQSLLEGYPHTVLESDGHGGTAGFVTRIQAFMHSVRQFRGEREATLPDIERRVAYISPGQHRGAYLDRDVRYVFLSGSDNLGEAFAATYRAYGYDAHAAPALSPRGYELGRRDCSGKECLSYQFVWGAFREYLEQNPSDREVRLLQISGRQCRAGAFPCKDRVNVERMGLSDRVKVVPLRVAGGPGMTARAWTGLAVFDILRQLFLYHLPVEERPGESEALYRGFCDRAVAILEERVPRGRLAGSMAAARAWKQLEALLDEAAGTWQRLEERAPARDFRTVYVSGDLLTKGCDFANGGLFRHLAARGVRVVYEPVCDFLEFLARQHPALIFGRSSNWRRNLPYLISMVLIRRRLYGRIRRLHPWLPMPDIGGAIRSSGELLAPETNGGSALAVGSVLQHWDRGHYDGIVITSCWGCDNGLIEESLLRNRDDIPSYFFYDDATPIDLRKLDSFAFRLQRAAG